MLDTLVEVAGEHNCAKKSHTRSSRATQTDLRMAHQLLMWMLATGQGTLRNLPVTTAPSTADEEYPSEQGTWIGVCTRAQRCPR